MSYELGLIIPDGVAGILAGVVVVVVVQTLIWLLYERD